MKTLAFFDTKPYDMIWFDRLKKDYDVDFKYYENKLSRDTAILAKGCDGVVAFVNDTIDKEVIDILAENKITLLAMRCSGYNNIDFKAAHEKIHVVRVPKYSPYAVAEHALALLLCLNRKIHKAYIRTRDFNFSLNGLCGWDLNGKTMGSDRNGKNRSGAGEDQQRLWYGGFRVRRISQSVRRYCLYGFGRPVKAQRCHIPTLSAYTRHPLHHQ